MTTHTLARPRDSVFAQGTSPVGTGMLSPHVAMLKQRGSWRAQRVAWGGGVAATPVLSPSLGQAQGLC